MTQEELGKLPWREVESSNIARVAWCEDQRLFIEFHTDEDDPPSVYQYEDVPQFRYERLVEAQSVGSMFSKIIRDKFAYGRVMVEEDEERQLEQRVTELEAEVKALRADLSNVSRGLKALMRPGGDRSAVSLSRPGA